MGDVVLLATDGLFDNVFDEEIIKILTDASKSTAEKAAVVAKTAYKHSIDPSYVSPFAMKEREYFAFKLGLPTKDTGFPGRNRIVGGKMDDITVVVATVQESDDFSAVTSKL